MCYMQVCVLLSLKKPYTDSESISPVSLPGTRHHWHSLLSIQCVPLHSQLCIYLASFLPFSRDIQSFVYRVIVCSSRSGVFWDNLINTSQYGLYHVGPWLNTTVIVLFWVDVALAMLASSAIYLLMFVFWNGGLGDY